MSDGGADCDIVDAVEVALRAMVSRGVNVAVRRIDAADELALFDEERRAVRTAVATRRREFATGRAALRQAIGRHVPIPVAADRRPILPTGIVASLAHDDRVAVAVAASAATIAALGIDIEPAVELDPDVAAAIVRADDAVTEPVLVLVLKEAAYKAWSAIGGRMLGHDDVRLTDVADSAFVATVEPDGVALSGRFALAAGAWLAVVELPA